MNEKKQVSRGRWQLGLLALVFFGPLLYAIWLYYADSEVTTGINYGELLTPPVMLDAKAHFDSGLRGRWTLMVLPEDDCDERCRKALIDIRQVRLATGREIDRIERAVIARSEPAGLAQVLGDHPGLIVVTDAVPGGESINSALAALPRGHIYLLDPVGNVILRYPLQPDRKSMLGDLKKLLKLSRIG